MIGLIGLAGALGTMFRFIVGKQLQTKSNFPFGTWVINLTGSFVLGMLFSFKENHLISPSLWLILGTGFCGGYTTFSTFNYETLQLFVSKKSITGFVYLLGSIALSLVFVFAGMKVVDLMK